ncbi:MAG: hypothetical protein IJ514_02780 [Clostridia bacterium]|nr:hypothetical protein [Clostridia bacterium]
MTLYKTQKWKGDDKKTYWYEYKLEEKEVRKWLCREDKMFESNVGSDCVIGQIVEHWSIDDPNKPKEVRQYLPSKN